VGRSIAHERRLLADYQDAASRVVLFAGGFLESYPLHKGIPSKMLQKTCVWSFLAVLPIGRSFST
jgi:hypothetical protein